MKKILVGFFAMVMALGAHAVAFEWSFASAGAGYSGKGEDSDFVASGLTVYLIDQAALSQNSLMTAIAGGTSFADAISGKYLKTSSIVGEEGTMTKVASTSFMSPSRVGGGDAYAGNDKVVFYSVLKDGDHYYFSAQKSVVVSATAKTAVGGGTSTSWEAETTFTTGTSVSTAGGWYSVSTVPEPSSGLLLLIGAGLVGLRRRRA